MRVGTIRNRSSATIRADDDPAEPADLARAAGAYLAVAGVVLTVYRLTLLPGIGYFGDTAKFQFVGKVLGIPHATGYPTYVVLNHLFVTLFPFGSSAAKANLLSAVFAAGAIVLLTALLRRLGVRTTVACATALAFAFTPGLWSQSVIAEVYTLHLLFVAAIVYLLVAWSEGASQAHLYLAVAILAVAFGNHLTTVTLVPAVLFIVLANRGRGVSRTTAIFAVVAAVAGASQYLFLIARARMGADYLEHAPTGVKGLWYVVSGAQFKPLMFRFTPAELLTERIPQFLGFMWSDMSLLVVVAVVGLAVARIPSRITVFLGVLAIANVAWALNYDIPDIAVYLLPTYLVIAVFAGLGLEHVIRRISREATRQVVAWALLGLLPAAFLARSYVDVDQSDNTADARRIERIVAAVGERAVVLSSDYSTSEYLWYFFIGEGLGRNRGVHVAHEYSPDEVAGYLREGGPLLYTPGRYRFPPPTTPRGAPAVTAPPGVRVFIVAPEQAADLTAQGLVIRPVDGGIWEVTA